MVVFAVLYQTVTKLPIYLKQQQIYFLEKVPTLFQSFIPTPGFRVNPLALKKRVTRGSG